jgi:hypothetical protein
MKFIAERLGAPPQRVTVYRFGSKSTQVIELGATERPDRYLHGSKCDPDECRL